jgi:hypothetical protein
VGEGNGFDGGSELMRLLSREPREMKKSDWTSEKIIKRVIRRSLVRERTSQWTQQRKATSYFELADAPRTARFSIL